MTLRGSQTCIQEKHVMYCHKKMVAEILASHEHIHGLQNSVIGTVLVPAVTYHFGS